MKKIFATIAATTLLLLPVFALFHGYGIAHAQAPTPGQSTPLQNPIKYNNFTDFVAGVTKAAVEVLLPFVVLSFIYTGFLFVKAQGKPGELDKAKSTLMYSAIGAFILFGAWALASIISKTVTSITQ